MSIQSYFSGNTREAEGEDHLHSSHCAQWPGESAIIEDTDISGDGAGMATGISFLRLPYSSSSSSSFLSPCLSLHPPNLIHHAFSSF